MCVLVVLYGQEGRRGGGGGSRLREEGRAPARGPLRRRLRALPPQLDPVVKAEREAGRGRLAAREGRRERGRRGAEARRGEAGRQAGREPRADLAPASPRRAELGCGAERAPPIPRARAGREPHGEPGWQRVRGSCAGCRPGRAACGARALGPGRPAEGLAVQRFRLFRFPGGLEAEFLEFPPEEQKVRELQAERQRGDGRAAPLSPGRGLSAGRNGW